MPLIGLLGLFWCKKVVRWPSSWKLNETEQRFTVIEKEMTAVVHCLRLWIGDIIYWVGSLKSRQIMLQ